MKMRFFALMALAVIGALLLGACATAAPTPTDSPAATDPLDGTSWELMAYRKTRPLPGTTISSVFENGQVSGSAGCNSYSGPYRVSGGTITVGPIAITEMACLEPEGMMEQEMTFTTYLNDAQRFRLSDDQLEIFQSEGEALTFVPRAQE